MILMSFSENWYAPNWTTKSNKQNIERNMIDEFTIMDSS